MTVSGWAQIIIFIVVLTALVPLLGATWRASTVTQPTALLTRAAGFTKS